MEGEDSRVSAREGSAADGPQAGVETLNSCRQRQQRSKRAANDGKQRERQAGERGSRIMLTASCQRADGRAPGETNGGQAGSSSDSAPLTRSDLSIHVGDVLIVHQDLDAVERLLRQLTQFLCHFHHHGGRDILIRLQQQQ